MLLPLRNISGRRQRNTTPCWWLCTHCVPTHRNTADLGLFDSSIVYSPPFAPHLFFKLRVCTISHGNLRRSASIKTTVGEIEMLFTSLRAIVVTSVALRHWHSCSHQETNTHFHSLTHTHLHRHTHTRTHAPGVQVVCRCVTCPVITFQNVWLINADVFS